MSFKKRCKEIYVVIKDTITHTEIGKMLVFMFSKGVFSTFITSTIKDPNVTGINIKKEKCAALSSSKFLDFKALIVIPDLDIPGIIPIA